MHSINTKQLNTLKDIMAKEPKSNINWSDVEELMAALGAIIEEGKGSRGSFVLQKRVFRFHRPHPQKEAKLYHVRDLKKFLTERGITYES